MKLELVSIPSRWSLRFTDAVKALKSNFGLDLNYDHLFSVEIMPHKQAYIERNFAPEYIFRDIRQLSKGTEA